MIDIHTYKSNDIFFTYNIYRSQAMYFRYKKVSLGVFPSKTKPKSTTTTKYSSQLAGKTRITMNTNLQVRSYIYYIHNVMHKIYTPNDTYTYSEFTYVDST